MDRLRRTNYAHQAGGDPEDEDLHHMMQHRAQIEKNVSSF
jgi:hypothetical protein